MFERWICDKCLKAVFFGYNKAVEHEKTCTGGNAMLSKKKSRWSRQAVEHEEAAIDSQVGIHILIYDVCISLLLAFVLTTNLFLLYKSNVHLLAQRKELPKRPSF